MKEKIDRPRNKKKEIKTKRKWDEIRAGEKNK